MARTAPKAQKRSDAKAGQDPERRCLVTRETAGRAGLIRFALDPQGHVVPDIEERLPGRGLWVTADRAILSRAVEKRLFARAAKGKAIADPDLVDRTVALLVGRCVQLLALARRAGAAVAGQAKVEQALSQLPAGGTGLLLEAHDGAEQGRRKLRNLSRQVVDDGLPVFEALSAAELARPFGRDHVVHGFVSGAGAHAALVDRLIREDRRLQGLRTGMTPAGDGECLENVAGACMQGATAMKTS